MIEVWLHLSQRWMLIKMIEVWLHLSQRWMLIKIINKSYIDLAPPFQKVEKVEKVEKD